jgi:hypothetical protein
VAPGIVVLDQALDLVLASLPGRQLRGLLVAKFTAIAPLDMAIEVRCAGVRRATSHSSHVDFACLSGGRTVARGTAEIGNLTA